MLFVHTACTSCFAGGRVISDEPSVSYLMQGGVNCLCEANLAHLCCTWTHLSCLCYGKGLSSVQVNKYRHLERKGNSTDHYNLDTPHIPSEAVAALVSSQARRGGGSSKGSWTGALHASQASTYRPQNLHPKPLTNEVKEKYGTGTKSGHGLSPDSRAADAAWWVVHHSAVSNTLAELKCPPAWTKHTLPLP